MKNKFVVGFLIAASVIGSSVIFYAYQILFTPNLRLDQTEKWLYIPQGADYKQVVDSLKQGDFLNDELSFSFLAKLTGYQDKVIPGAYLVAPNTTNKDLIWRLKAGRQSSIKLTFNNLRLKSDLVNRLSSKLNIAPEAFYGYLNNPDSCRMLGFDTLTVTAMFIPNTYDLYWNTPIHKFMRRMQTEYNTFWSAKGREEKAKALGLTKIQVHVLASITEAETKKADEMPIVAKVYKNRLDQDMLLQADPTVIYALKDFTIKRVYTGTINKAGMNPFNTYKVKGFPPAPINLPSITAIDAVLNMADHKYIYFCANASLNGYHSFAVTYEEHMANVAKYTKALDTMGIK